MWALTYTTWDQTREIDGIEPEERSPKYFGLRDGEGEAAYVVLAGLRAEPRWLRASGGTLGALEIPVRDYLELASAVRSSTPNHASSLPPSDLTLSLRPFIQNFDEGVGLASTRRIPWQLAVQRIHPAEPDILGVLAMIQLAVRDDRLPTALRQIEMSNFCRMLLFPCLNTRFEGTEFGDLFLM
jgi:hypothetical protein